MERVNTMTVQSDTELTISISRELEKTLKEHFNASGTGLGQMVRSLSEVLPPSVAKNLNWIANTRNKVAHETGTLNSRKELEKRARTAQVDLRSLIRFNTVGSAGGSPNKKAAHFHPGRVIQYCGSSGSDVPPYSVHEFNPQFSIQGFAEQLCHLCVQLSADGKMPLIGFVKQNMMINQGQLVFSTEFTPQTNREIFMAEGPNGIAQPHIAVEVDHESLQQVIRWHSATQLYYRLLITEDSIDGPIITETSWEEMFCDFPGIGIQSTR